MQSNPKDQPTPKMAAVLAELKGLPQQSRRKVLALLKLKQGRPVVTPKG